MAWHRPGDKPLSEPLIIRLPTHLCVTRPQTMTCSFLCIKWVPCSVCASKNDAFQISWLCLLLCDTFWLFLTKYIKISRYHFPFKQLDIVWFKSRYWKYPNLVDMAHVYVFENNKRIYIPAVLCWVQRPIFLLPCLGSQHFQSAFYRNLWFGHLCDDISSGHVQSKTVLNDFSQPNEKRKFISFGIHFQIFMWISSLIFLLRVWYIFWINKYWSQVSDIRRTLVGNKLSITQM